MLFSIRSVIGKYRNGKQIVYLLKREVFMVAPSIAAEALLQGGKVVVGSVSTITQAIKALYGFAGDINECLNKHVEDMTHSENPTISRSGKVIELAKQGFGIGYITPVVIIATGQLLLGNTFAAIGTVATAATLTNPIAMTCAAIGAIYYGWGALSNVERNEILDKISKGLEIGIELIKSIVRFVTDKTKDLLSSKNIEEIKKFMGSAAAVFGKTLGDVTHKVADVIGDTINVVKKKSGEAMEMTGHVAVDAYRSVSVTASDAYQTVSDTRCASR